MGLNVPLNKLKDSGQVVSFIESLWKEKRQDEKLYL